MILALVLVPTLAGIAAFVIRWDQLRRVLLLLTGIAHLVMTVVCWVVHPAPALNGWLALDAPGLLFLSITSALFLAAAIYGLGYLSHEKHVPEEDFETVSGLIFSILGRIPIVGEVVHYKNLELEIVEADKRRIHRVRIKEMPREEQVVDAH